METKATTLAALCAAAALAGCAGTPTSKAPAAPQTLPALAPIGPALPPPVPGVVPVCAMSSQTVDTCVRKALRTYVCHAWVGGAPNQPFVYPYNIAVPRGATNVTFVWHLLDKDYRFRDKNDGPVGLPAPFTDGDTTDDDEGGKSLSGSPARKFRYKFTNPGASRFPYTIQFGVPDPVNPSILTTVKCDPTITSSAN